MMFDIPMKCHPISPILPTPFIPFVPQMKNVTNVKWCSVSLSRVYVGWVETKASWIPWKSPSWAGRADDVPKGGPVYMGDHIVPWILFSASFSQGLLSFTCHYSKNRHLSKVLHLYGKGGKGGLPTCHFYGKGDTIFSLFDGDFNFETTIIRIFCLLAFLFVHPSVLLFLPSSSLLRIQCTMFKILPKCTLLLAHPWFFNYSKHLFLWHCDWKNDLLTREHHFWAKMI